MNLEEELRQEPLKEPALGLEVVGLQAPEPPLSLRFNTGTENTHGVRGGVGSLSIDHTITCTELMNGQQQGDRGFHTAATLALPGTDFLDHFLAISTPTNITHAPAGCESMPSRYLSDPRSWRILLAA